MTWWSLTRKIHRQFSKWLLTFQHSLSSKLPERVCREEEITSFARSLRRDVNQQTWRIRPERFYPRRGPTGQWETSVCRSTTLTAQQVWELCTKHFDPSLSKPAIGRGIGPASCIVQEHGLYMHGDGNPHPYHANILGWRDEPGRDEKDLKHYWMHAAQRIASNFPYVARPG